MMHKYLDTNEASHFQSLFGGTAIADVDDAEHRNAYHVMKFDFSVNIGDG
eukprot:CAMPEP_0174871080 /NCGR_PEP_ID=MMETSP1114-20130205/70836_1 /TAXON_ID=312471 /ORGANISM="Neobodo designis, Strain CCAP 1951/1" /LENGTH=49 /DNA_ID= /DNA_START= /DNA_END= /DNA_ORIENTATION=